MLSEIGKVHSVNSEISSPALLTDMERVKFYKDAILKQ